MTVPSLAQEILAALPSMLVALPRGASIGDVAERLSVDIKSVRAAFRELNDAKKARIVRRGSGGAFYLVSSDYPVRICVICSFEFQATRKSTVTCSHSCGRYLAWQNVEMRARHRASVKAARAAPGARNRASRLHRKRCADPAVRQRMSEIQRRAWANPETKIRRTIGMKKAWEGADDRRAAASQRKQRQWRTKAFREKAVAGMRDGKRARVHRRILEVAAASPEMSHCEIAALVGRAEDTVSVVLRHARRDGLIGPRIGDGPRLRLKAVAGGIRPHMTTQESGAGELPAHPKDTPAADRVLPICGGGAGYREHPISSEAAVERPNHGSSPRAAAEPVTLRVAHG